MRRTRQLLFSPETVRLEILTTPLNRLGLTIEGTLFGGAIAQALEDTKRARIRKIEPVFYLSTGYGTVEGTNNIGVGFYDATETLRDLNKEFRGWVYSYDDVVATLRHEIGHAFCYAYKLYRRPDFRRVFNVRGNFFRTYPVTERYIHRANPWSRDYVNPSGDHYAQKHPDDDFAETFLVWLTPRSGWRRAYRKYPGALRKLEYVEFIVKELGRQAPLVENDPAMLDQPLEELTQTVAQFFKARTTKYRRRATGFVDADLHSLFRPRPASRNGRKPERDHVHAANFLRDNKRAITTRVSLWIGVEERVVRDLIEKCAERAAALDLWLRKDDREKQLIEVTSYISMRCGLYAVYERYF
ncbi:MAG: hypothetical protein HY260_14070 [Chloroflexi bacterium]|nr:hypothetical protein [Chloroflexota bacterium]